MKTALNTPVIVAAANRLPTGVLLVGARHWDTVMRAQFKAMYGDDAFTSGKVFTHSEIEQGFIDQFGQFYNRKHAMDCVMVTGQKLRNPLATFELYSEDLY